MKKIFSLMIRKLFGITKWDSEVCNIGQGTIVKNNFEVNVRTITKKVYVTIGEKSVVRGHVNIENENGFIEIGNNCNIGENCTFNSVCGIKIGNNVLISWNVIFYDHNAHSTDADLRREDIVSIYEREISGDIMEWREKRKNWNIVGKAPIVVKDDVWIGFDAVIMKGVTIGEGAVVASRSVVTHDVPPYTVVAGNPASIVKRLR